MGGMDSDALPRLQGADGVDFCDVHDGTHGFKCGAAAFTHLGREKMGVGSAEGQAVAKFLTVGPQWVLKFDITGGRTAGCSFLVTHLIAKINGGNKNENK